MTVSQYDTTASFVQLGTYAGFYSNAATLNRDTAVGQANMRLVFTSDSSVTGSGIFMTVTQICPGDCPSTISNCSIAVLPSIPSNSLTGNCPDSIRSGDICTKSCAANFTAVQSLAVTCLNGTFSNPIGNCFPSCTQSPLISNSLLGTCTVPSSSNTQCALSCSPGYFASGSLATTCLTTGSWTTVTGRCELASPCTAAVPLPPNTLPAGCVVGQPAGTSCQLSCQDGYRLTSGSSFLTCSNTGQWSISNMVCSPNCQAAPALPANSVAGTCVIPVNGFGSGLSCTVSCLTNYSASGSLTSVCSTLNGQFSAITGSCLPSCTVPPALPPTSNLLVGSCNQILAPGQTCQTQCQSGFTLTSGSHSSTCQSGSSTYSVPSAVCSPNCANLPTLLPNVLLSLSFFFLSFFSFSF